MSGQHWAKYVKDGWYHRRYGNSQLPDQLPGFASRWGVPVCQGYGCPGCQAPDCWNEVPGLCAGDKCPGCKTCWSDPLPYSSPANTYPPLAERPDKGFSFTAKPTEERLIASCPKHGCFKTTICKDPAHWPEPTEEPMNESLKLAYTLNLTTWNTVAFLLERGEVQSLLDVAKANVETLRVLLKDKD